MGNVSGAFWPNVDQQVTESQIWEPLFTIAIPAPIVMVVGKAVLELFVNSYSEAWEKENAYSYKFFFTSLVKL